jgi:ligand-binding SRPBCC domain-containing protein
MIFRHSFRVRAPLASVAAFHRRPETLAELTPLLRVQLDRAPRVAEDGDELAFRIWIGPWPLRWRARIEGLTSTGFVDRQLSGPFRLWVHRHTFVPVDAETTVVQDEVRADLRPQTRRGVIALAMWLSLPFLFAFRAWKTRRLLESRR